MIATSIHRIAQLLRLLPAPVHRALDRWSYRLALKRRERRYRVGRKVAAAR